MRSIGEGACKSKRSFAPETSARVGAGLVIKLKISVGLPPLADRNRASAGNSGRGDEPGNNCWPDPAISSLLITVFIVSLILAAPVPRVSSSAFINERRTARPGCRSVSGMEGGAVSAATSLAAVFKESAVAPASAEALEVAAGASIPNAAAMAEVTLRTESSVGGEAVAVSSALGSAVFAITAVFGRMVMFDAAVIWLD